MNQLLERLKGDLQDEEARYSYADSVTNAFVAAQIKALREDRDLNQEELAGLIGTKQSGISRLERADYSAWKVETLRKIARAFGVRLRIRFEGFGSLPDEVGGFDRTNLAPHKFEDDPAFKETNESGHARIQGLAAAQAQIGTTKRSTVNCSNEYPKLNSSRSAVGSQNEARQDSPMPSRMPPGSALPRREVSAWNS